MELLEFLALTQAEVRVQISDRLDERGAAYPYPESVFTEVVMAHMFDVGMIDEPTVCHFAARVGNAQLRLSGYAFSEDGTSLDLFVSLYAGVDDLNPIPDGETKLAAEQCLRFLSRCADGRLVGMLDEANDAHVLAVTVRDSYSLLEQVDIYVLTDRVAKSKSFQAREIGGKTVRLEVMDIERLFRHWAAGKPRDELVVDFTVLCGGALPCVYVGGDSSEYDYALTVIPGEALRFLYEKYGARLLEANVRSFLGASGRVNPGIQQTLRECPERFVAYNNGIVIVTDEVRLGTTADGGPGIAWLTGLQIVNGGQTTASIYFTKKKYNEVDLRRVRVPAKIVLLKSPDPVGEEALISDISRYANSQNAVRQSDLSANKPFHVEMEKLSNAVFCPDGVGRWFYERAAGSYNVMLAREGTTSARLRKLREAIPPSRRLTKTDFAKHFNAWEGKPHIVSRGSQKNFVDFSDTLSANPDAAALLDVTAYQHAIARTIVFRRASTIIRPLFQAYQANVTAYTVAWLSRCFGERFELGKVWLQQCLSPALEQQLRVWAVEVNQALQRYAGGRMLSEAAKLEDCARTVLQARYSEETRPIPEVRG